MNHDTTPTSPVTFHTEGALGVISIDNPPVNALSPVVMEGLSAAFQSFEDQAALEALVIECMGRTFVAGGDINAFDRPDFSAAPFNALLGRIEASERPVVAATFGTVLGGGLELAMACHARVGTPKTKYGMPEIMLGLMPGSLGTQRLPRLVGLELAARMIRGGAPIGAEAALSAGLIDVVVEEPNAGARSHALGLIGKPPRRSGALSVEITPEGAAELESIRAEGESKPHLPAVAGIAAALDAACTKDFAEGEAIEARIFDELVDSRASRAQRHLFMAERKARKVPGIASDTPVRNVASVGIVGAGTMGTGIALAFVNAEFPTQIVDSNDEAILRSKKTVEGYFDKSVARGRMSRGDADRRLAHVTWHKELPDLANAHLIIEAVFEDMALKCSIAEELGKVSKPGAIIATNTSTLDVDEIAAATGRPGDVLGMHFFSPAHIMRLLEVVRGRETRSDVLQTVMKLTPRIRKTPVVSGVCYGFIGNRMVEPYCREDEAMIVGGATPAQIDAVIESPEWLGMAMGPNRMMDMAGVDVGARVVSSWLASGTGPSDPNYRRLIREMFNLGHCGQKSGEGFYRYQGRDLFESEALATLAVDLAKEMGVERRNLDEQEIFERLFYPMVNEAALILQDGIASRASDIDVVWTAGYGFPAWQGGPLFMADEIGLSKIVERLDHYANTLGNTSGHWTVAPLLRQLAAEGRRISHWTGE